MRTNMKSNWADLISETKLNADELFGMSAIFLADQKVKLCVGDYLYIKDGLIEKSTLSNATHYIKKIQGTISGIPKCITLVNISTNLIETIDL